MSARGINASTKRLVKTHESQLAVIKGLLKKEVPVVEEDVEADPITQPDSFNTAVQLMEQRWAEKGEEFSVEKIAAMYLWKKRVLLLFIYSFMFFAAIMLLRGAYINALLVGVFSAVCISFVFPNQFRLWQLRTRRLTEEEGGSVANFKTENAWLLQCMNPELPSKMSKIVIALVAALFICSPFLAHADDLDQITNASDVSTDLSRQALVTIFGQVVNDPLASASEEGGDTLIAQIFKVFGSTLLIIGTAWAGYIALKKTAHHAHDGTFMDSQQHNLWMPIRVLSGFSMLVPLANGWSMSSLLMLYAASKVGVGAANLGTSAAVDSFMNGQTFVLQPVAPSTDALARSLFEANLCMFGINASLDSIASSED